ARGVNMCGGGRSGSGNQIFSDNEFKNHCIKSGRARLSKLMVTPLRRPVLGMDAFITHRGVRECVCGCESYGVCVWRCVCVSERESVCVCVCVCVCERERERECVCVCVYVC